MSLTLILEMAESGLGDRVAFGGRAGGLTYRKIADRVARASGVIADHDPSHVVYLGGNGPAFPQLLFSAAAAGVPFVPMNYRFSDDVLADLLSEFERPLMIVESRHEGRAGSGGPILSVEQFIERADAHEPVAPVVVPDEAPVVLIYTSGTTSRPKAVPLRQENLLSYVMSTVEFASADTDETALVSVPPYHVAALGSALTNFYSGRRVVYLPDFDARAWLNMVNEESVTFAMVVPTMLARIVDLLDGELADAPALRMISYGGARMPRPVLAKALRAFPGVGFCNAYGLTETSSTLALLGPDDHRVALESDDPVVRERLGSVGRPVPGIEIQVRDDRGNVVSAGVVGELYVRGSQVSGEYVGKGSALDVDGWFPTRDRAWIDEEGYLFIGGRADDTIIRGGENIAPAEIEDVLFSHPGVRDVAVIGLPDEEWGQKLVAVVVPEPEKSPDVEELRGYVRSKLRGSRTPDEIVWEEVLPTTPTGKVLRRALVDKYAKASS
ncbi:class I adenylate-forming enzyme family protein [Nocardia arizonensis]|uniref:class I adenylate-forming enzyme family protein n=1 Tax=Nocardia arizonensis TaxID=1141647 RepID=UPI0006D0C132|nr:class I adenylate-forming enzyme family protein [Nocardia arizonensis]